jgi:hypothetical protein
LFKRFRGRQKEFNVIGAESLSILDGKLKSGRGLLAYTYEDEAKFKKMRLQGAISFNEFKSKLPSLPKDQEIVFY